MIYTESAEKTAYFIGTCNRQETPHSSSGTFPVLWSASKPSNPASSAGARFVEAITNHSSKIVLTLNHPGGAGYYAMPGQGFDPDFIFTLPTHRMGVMEGESAVIALFASQLENSGLRGWNRTKNSPRRNEQSAQITNDNSTPIRRRAAQVDAV
ncbi:MAG: hypothetical protein IPJ07_10860 [Acidobacteria bacterium]|nr:hypothetical protein [Acidobacteriota bacterium]